MIRREYQYHPRPEFKSTAWVEHNATIAEKRERLGFGPRPRIGKFARWNVQPKPAIEAYLKPPRYGFWRGLRDLLMLIGAVVSIGLMFYVGAIVGF